MRTFESVADLAAAAGEKVGQSDWVTITQEEVNLFADATGDHQWIHVDPEREPPRHVRRLQFLERMGSCQVVHRGGTRRSCVSGRCGWSQRS
ncbi:MaoC/PaaZ C-terminal domain-containing protein, partial [Mycobacterium tuberculosis]